MKKIVILALSLAIFALFGTVALASDTCSLVVRPNLVLIGTTFNGMPLTITGTIPEGTTAVLRLMDESHTKHFKKKGKALGLLWMNLETVELKNVPDVFLIGTEASDHDDMIHSTLGFESVKGETDELIFEEFVKLMEQDDLYQVQNGIISSEPGKDGQRAIKATLSVPSAMHKGKYAVELLAIKDGKIVAKATSELHAELTGFPAMLSVIAYEHPLIYGIAAVIIAILAGLFMTMLFKDKGGMH